MYDTSSKFSTFYKEFVVLPQEEKSKLYQKEELNIKRLKDGLNEYNDENKTSYRIVETCVQGSVRMSTVVQNESCDYDIDVAVVFDKADLADKGAQATRNIIANALRRKTGQFNEDPETKTGCVRIKYSDGYHVDFAIYRRILDEDSMTYKYEHAGSDWTERDLKGLTEWFEEKNNETQDKLRMVVRLIKTFCKSRPPWINMPSGLLQTVICEETIQLEYDRIDELFYHTMQRVVERLDESVTVQAPVDQGRDLTPRQSDRKKMINLRNRLKSKLEDLEILFNDNCSQVDALQAWYGFFNHDYWKEQIAGFANYSLENQRSRGVVSYSDTEEFIEDLFKVEISESLDVSCTVQGKGWRPKLLATFISSINRFLPHNLEIRCSVINTSATLPYDIYWKVKNVGPEAERRNQIRGQIQKRGKEIVEHTNFYGNHYIECYIVKNDVCVARERVRVPIGIA